MEAIVLAGGLGTRLRGEIGDVPKPMAPVEGKPFLEYVFEALIREGVGRAVLSVGYRHEVIRDRFGDAFGALSLAYVIEETPLGTGGAIRRSLDATTANVSFVLNGDTFVDVDLEGMQARHRANGALVSMAVKHVDDVGRFGSLRIVNDVVTGFIEKGASGPGDINAGVYLLPKNVFDAHDLPERFSFENEFLQPFIGEIAPRAFRARGPFIDIGVPDDYRSAAAFFKALSR